MNDMIKKIQELEFTVTGGFAIGTAILWGYVVVLLTSGIISLICKIIMSF